ncbi:uncharacterized protein KY384_009053 [Bacidia gigantensis]|uniref:uncharacterized protein n=1 Tax=Bacidia gigantensis TaxID=2732470 RepID=UPI001D04EC2A|nr:uncharacterized protein KY384_009053 [Bacidia gigantensis]KAG8525409.1 hypothetical protein KY384_009053 [Bacidia gigantensis]
MSNIYNRSPVSPLDFDPPPKQSHGSNIGEGVTKSTNVLVRSTTSSSSSSRPSLSSPRTARFAEATSINSPVDPSQARNPFKDPPKPSTRHLMPEPQPSDVGFGYVSDQQASKHTSFAEVPITPNSPLKSALKVPGTPGNKNPLSPTFKEEEDLEKAEGKTEKQNAKDLVIKTRVRMAKMCLRMTNFSCSLIVLSMLSATFTIFNASRALPNRGKFPPWAPKQQIWPQVTMLVIAAVSLFMALGVFYAYWKGGHRRAEKAAIYYTFFSIAFFTFSIIMWSVGAAILSQSKKNGKGNDMWGWACKDGTRKNLFSQDVDYSLICRLQHWSLICAFIEIIVEIITIAIYAIVFYRFYSKRRLHKSMDVRDKARSDLYLAQLRSQSAPNTPGFQKTPLSPRFPDSVRNQMMDDDEKGDSTQYAAKRQSFSQPKPFALQAPPIKVHAASPTTSQDAFGTAPRAQEPVPAAPGEQTYEAVPIPGAYSTPLASPGIQSQQMGSIPGQAMTTNQRIESPPSSPRLGKVTLH